MISKTATYWRVIQVFLWVPKAPLKIVANMEIGLSPVQIMVTIPQTMSEITIAIILIVQAVRLSASALFDI